jgi:hypothetical protein
MQCGIFCKECVLFLREVANDGSIVVMFRIPEGLHVGQYVLDVM